MQVNLGIDLSTEAGNSCPLGHGEAFLNDKALLYDNAKMVRKTGKKITQQRYVLILEGG